LLSTLELLGTTRVFSPFCQSPSPRILPPASSREFFYRQNWQLSSSSNFLSYPVFPDFLNVTRQEADECVEKSRPCLRGSSRAERTRMSKTLSAFLPRPVFFFPKATTAIHPIFFSVKPPPPLGGSEIFFLRVFQAQPTTPPQTKTPPPPPPPPPSPLLLFLRSRQPAPGKRPFFVFRNDLPSSGAFFFFFVLCFFCINSRPLQPGTLRGCRATPLEVRNVPPHFWAPRHLMNVPVLRFLALFSR